MSDRLELSDAEIDRIVDKVVDKLEKKIYINVGQGIVALIWRGIIIALLAIAAYGAGVHFFK